MKHSTHWVHLVLNARINKRPGDRLKRMHFSSRVCDFVGSNLMDDECARGAWTSNEIWKCICAPLADVYSWTFFRFAGQHTVICSRILFALENGNVKKKKRKNEMWTTNMDAPADQSAWVIRHQSQRTITIYSQILTFPVTMGRHDANERSGEIFMIVHFN